MENFLERLNSLLDDDPFSDINENLLSPNDHEVCSVIFILFFVIEVICI